MEAKADELGWESVAVLAEDYNWTEPVSSVLSDGLADTGVEVVLNRRYASGTEDFSPVYNEVENSGADTVVSGLEDSSYTGTAGTIECYGPDDEFAHDVNYDRELVWPVFMQWQPDDADDPAAGGAQEVVFPDELATAEYQTPPWV